MKKQLEIIDERVVLDKEFRVFGDFENPLFLAKDVAEWIEHNKPNEMISNVDDDEKLKAIISPSGQKREVWMLTEDGLYEVLMQSRKPIAKQFKKQVKAILKEIRKTGEYQTPRKKSEKLSSINNAARTIFPVMENSYITPLTICSIAV
ncbi:MAG: Bro-N domain-containing protein [Peptostreptococcaceae bacterium]|nr:Bro-N domain-containing protein [Peptostreptococcaceae bacterium]